LILLVVGTQLPFDRLTKAVDDWAGLRGRTNVFAQIGPTEFKPRHMQWVEFMEPADYQRRFEQATLLVAHAGMGSIIGALEASKPVLIMPRKASLGEHRNEHQLATAERFRGRPGVFVADNEGEIAAILDRHESLAAGSPIDRYAQPRLIQRLRGFIQSGR
jgi:UDP-N-acetylglucosamine transferase subunit ALG13